MGAGATTGVAVAGLPSVLGSGVALVAARLAGAFFAGAFVAFAGALAEAWAGAFFAGAFLAAARLVAFAGPAFMTGSFPAAASAAATFSSTARCRSSLPATGTVPRSLPRSSVVIVSPFSWVLGCPGGPGASLATRQSGQRVQRDHQPVRTVACLVDALVNGFVRLERPKEW